MRTINRRLTQNAKTQKYKDIVFSFESVSQLGLLAPSVGLKDKPFLPIPFPSPVF